MQQNHLQTDTGRIRNMSSIKNVEAMHVLLVFSGCLQDLILSREQKQKLRVAPGCSRKKKRAETADFTFYYDYVGQSAPILKTACFFIS